MIGAIFIPHSINTVVESNLMPVLQGNILGTYDPPLKLMLVSVAGWHAERSPWKCSSDSLHVFG